MSHHLTEQQLIELRQAFAWFDKSNQGVISADDLKQCLNGLGFYPRKSQLSLMLDAATSDQLTQSNGISFPDFLVMMSKVLETSEAIEEMEQIFQFLDIDGKGTLSIDDLYHSLRLIGEDYSYDEILNMIKLSDVNSDGEITFEEFVKLLMY